MIDREEKHFLDFIQMVSKLEPIEYCAICKILGVPLIDAEGGPLEFDATLENVLDKFLEMKKKPRRQLMKMLRDCTGGR